MRTSSRDIKHKNDSYKGNNHKCYAVSCYKRHLATH